MGIQPAPSALPQGVAHTTTDGEPEAPLCGRCDAVCCRLTVVLQPEDRIPSHYTDTTAAGLNVMARDAEGWCVAVDAARMSCSIYEVRPQVCRRFVMAGPYCREIRADYSERNARGIPLRLY
ncbi:MAG TPA: YkgJ family cysteine cluster protein [Luteimonas sp.]|nr:YkgJ family cysteine cluster protein [Luteimonas sp.]HRO27722.1 YkgJ family cysteine cluster protein [Luteimonas sp.]HRP71501.1 YkgJ family cysteine cluster protein [Luteimonas sp.]